MLEDKQYRGTDFLDREVEEDAGTLGHCTIHYCDGGEGPAVSTSALVLDGIEASETKTMDSALAYTTHN